MDENHQHPDEFYRYPDEDNTITRRRLDQHPRPRPHPHPTHTHQYQNPETNYQTYAQEEYHGGNYKYPYQSEGNTEGYSLEELHWYPGQRNDAKDTEEDFKDVPHPYRKEEEVYMTDFQGGSIEQSPSQSSSQSELSSQSQSPSQSAQHAVKVSDFPYEFHKGD
ncbi:hypothetical protein E2C01_072860 [Portunus trituberculatus]|uniref:Uncharacterized protein n=1 Tax=Portunus trituberculatus TaxID=210409 RepID=A0A5B7I8A5_PORTR|nr:hypothetical protein [Portunus trituberculatus]